jgi:hypothetical protein
MNHPVKRVKMEQVLGGDINHLLKEGDFQAIGEMKGGTQRIKSIEDIWVESTSKGVYMRLLKRFSVSSDGSKTWGVHITESEKSRVLMQDFETGECLGYDYEHKESVLAVVVAEDLDLVITGGYDGKTVLHCLETGETLKVLDVGVKGVYCLFRLGSVVAVAGKKQVEFLDLVTQKTMQMVSVEVECNVRCMQLGRKRSSRKNHPSRPILLIGGSFSTKVAEIKLPKEIVRRSTRSLRVWLTI